MYNPFLDRRSYSSRRKGKVTASFNSKGRPGAFHKSVYVTTNASDNKKILRIKGIVKTKEEKSKYSEAELKKSPKLVLEKEVHNFGQVEVGQEVSKDIKIKNLGRSPLKLKGIEAACRCVKAQPPESPVKPGEAATINLQYRPQGKGKVSDIVLFESNDLLNPTKSIELKAMVVESLTEESMIRKEKADVPGVHLVHLSPHF